MMRANVPLLGVALALAVSLLLAPQAVAQDEPVLTRDEVSQILKENKKLLAAAEKAEQRGDVEALEQHLGGFNERMDRLNEAIAADRMDAADKATVLERVDAATRKHLAVLERVQQRCLERGKSCEGIARALEASRHGNEAATAALAHMPPAQRHPMRHAQAGQPRHAGGHAGSRPGAGHGPGHHGPGRPPR